MYHNIFRNKAKVLAKFQVRVNMFFHSYDFVNAYKSATLLMSDRRLEMEGLGRR